MCGEVYILNGQTFMNKLATKRIVKVLRNLKFITVPVPTFEN
jgi:hypothetical protein